ncbi:hypothetical protein MC885_015209, partial [Smutsia gigantea]
MDLKHSCSVKLKDGHIMPVLGFVTLAPEETNPSSSSFLSVFQEPGEELMPKDASGKIILETVDLRDTWTALEKCKDAGLTKSIGVSNFNHKQLEMILNKLGLKYKPMCNQVECHPYLNQSKLLEFCKSEDIVLVAYGVLGSQRDPNLVQKHSPYLLEDAVLKEIAKKHNRNAGQISMRFLLQWWVVVLAKSFSEKRIKENFQVQANSASQRGMCARTGTI